MLAKAVALAGCFLAATWPYWWHWRCQHGCLCQRPSLAVGSYSDRQCHSYCERIHLRPPLRMCVLLHLQLLGLAGCGRKRLLLLWAALDLVRTGGSGAAAVAAGSGVTPGELGPAAGAAGDVWGLLRLSLAAMEPPDQPGQQVRTQCRTMYLTPGVDCLRSRLDAVVVVWARMIGCCTTKQRAVSGAWRTTQVTCCWLALALA
jgi:hypothetical protein